MVESLTQNYGWTKPEVTKSPTTWGGFLNVDLDSIDAIVFALQQGIHPIGGMMMWGGDMTSLPPNWLLCDGRSLDTTAYAALFAAIKYTHGGSGANFNLPPFSQRYPMGAGPNPPGQTGGGFSYTITIANLPWHTHGIVDVAHTHSVYDPTHAHSVADPTHTHPFNDPGHGHGASSYQDAHSHGLDHQVATSSGGPNVAGGGLWGIYSVRTDAAQPAVHTTVNWAGTGGYLSYSGVGIGIYGAATGIQLYGSGTGLSTTQGVGGGAAMSIIPPFVSVPIIIRYK